jgi:hypothetical protein
VIPLFYECKLLTQVARHGNHTIKLLPSLTISDEGSSNRSIRYRSRTTGAVGKLGKTLVGSAIRARIAARGRRLSDLQTLRRHVRAGENRGCRFVANPTDAPAHDMIIIDQTMRCDFSIRSPFPDTPSSG